MPDFAVGDIVMAATHAKRRRHKNTFWWNGPMEVTGSQSDFVFLVRPLGSLHEPKAVHIQRLKRFSDTSIGRSAELVEMA